MPYDNSAKKGDLGKWLTYEELGKHSKREEKDGAAVGVSMKNVRRRWFCKLSILSHCCLFRGMGPLCCTTSFSPNYVSPEKEETHGCWDWPTATAQTRLTYHKN